MIWTLLKIGIGIIIGAALVKEDTEASAAYDKGKAKIKKWIRKAAEGEHPGQDDAEQEGLQSD